MRYPIGLQDFGEVRRGGYVYVDKTAQIIKVIRSSKYAFLSRPRRFGKSLTVATMAELYSGTGELFDGLYAQDNWDFAAMQRPVIWVKFSRIDYERKGLHVALVDEMHRQHRILGLSAPGGDSVKDLFESLVWGAAASSPSGKTVILIDEYDRPIIDYLHDVPQAESNRDVLRSFYSIIKDADPYLEFVFITGITAFAKVSIFSTLNNVLNISLHPMARTIVGWTRDELEANFAEQLDATGVPRDTVRQWYNGYSWGGPERLYNPWSILNLLLSGELSNYWFESATPTFLVDLVKRSGGFDLTDFEINASHLTDFDFSNLDPAVVLFQTGYLTLGEYDEILRTYRLVYPNLEVRSSLEQYLLDAYVGYPSGSSLPRVTRLYRAFHRGDLDDIMRMIDALFAEIPHQLWAGSTERFFHAIVFLAFRLLGTYMTAEASTARGRADAVVEMADKVYVFEFKLDRPAAEALAQIESRGYATRFADDARELVRVGISFDSERRAVGEWLAG